MPLVSPKTRVPSESYWNTISDDRLLGLDLEIDGPDTLAGIVTKIPEGPEETYIEFTYDLRGSGREQEFVCVHGHHQHLHGAVMRKGEARFLVGWMCAESIYGEHLSNFKADYDAALQRRNALIRVYDLQNAMSEFALWADQLSESTAVSGFKEVRSDLSDRFPWIFELLRSRSGGRVQNVVMPKFLCEDYSSQTGGFDGVIERLLSEIAEANSLLSGNAHAVANRIGLVREKLEGIVRRANTLVSRLADVETFFQPQTLGALCQEAENAVPRRSKHFAGILKLTSRDRVIEMPSGFLLPSRAPIDKLAGVLSG